MVPSHGEPSGPVRGPAANQDRLLALLAEPLAAEGLDLEDVTVTSAGKRRLLRVAVDKDGGVSLDQVADATRAIGQVLDETSAMGEQAYTLEVGSPGVDRPLTLPRHWRRNRDRLVKVSLHDGETLTGRITGSDEESATLDVDGTERVVPIAAVERAKVQVEFKRKES